MLTIGNYANLFELLNSDEIQLQTIDTQNDDISQKRVTVQNISGFWGIRQARMLVSQEGEEIRGETEGFGGTRAYVTGRWNALTSAFDVRAEVRGSDGNLVQLHLEFRKQGRFLEQSVHAWDGNIGSLHHQWLEPQRWYLLSTDTRPM